jgi:hypothetical protein
MDTPIRLEIVLAERAWERAEATVEMRAETVSSLPAIEVTLDDIPETLLLTEVTAADVAA